MDTASLCHRKRPCGEADVQMHQELQCQPPAWKRRCRGEEKEMKKRKRGSFKEETDLCLPRSPRTQNLKLEPRRSSQFGTRTTVWTGSKPGAEIQMARTGVRVALIKKTRIQTAVQNLEQRGSKLAKGLSLKEQTDPDFRGDPILDQRCLTPDRQTRIKESTSELRLWSTASLVPYRFSDTTTNNEKKRNPGPQTPRRKDRAPRTRPTSMGRKNDVKTRRRKKIHPSMLRGRGQLRLSITPEAGHLIIHIHEALGLLGKSHRSCDSYVKLTVTSDLGYSVGMKTHTVLNNKNPKYDQSFRLCISDDLLLDRLLVSVFRRPCSSRCSQLVGCMSFGISSLVLSNKLIIGWFYLLGEEFGCSKHLRVTSERNRPMRCLKENKQTEKDLRRTPDSAPDTIINHVTTSTTAGLKDLKDCSLTSSPSPSFDPPNTNQCQERRDSSSHQRLLVSIIRGQDGFGFTISSDCPVRVQAVDPGGPAHQSGLHQGDSILQLNGLPVETWKCVDLAHAIRSCSAQIVLVVWRSLPELRSGCEGLLRPPVHNNITGRKLLRHPTHSKHGHQRGQGLRVRSSLGVLGSLWRDRKEDQEVEEEEEEDHEVTEYSPHTTTLKGTRVTSSNGDNYIILSPVNPGEQLLQPVYHDRTGTIAGQLFQTHTSRRQNPLHDPQPGLSERPFASITSTLPPPTSSTISSSALPSSCSTYQNCTIIQSHLPCTTLGTYISLAPKTVIFPVFVQPLDLCSPDRTLLMSEEMILHQADLLPAKVTVLIYNDLLLLTREDEANRCNVLQSPVYLNTLQLREVSSEPLHIYFLQNSQTCCRRLFSLECFSIEQKVRVTLCLHDNIQLQMVTTDPAPCHQLPDLPSDFGLLSLGQSNHLLRPSSPYSALCDTLKAPSPTLYFPSSHFSTTPPPPPFSSFSSYTSSSPVPRVINTLPHRLLSAPISSSSTLGSPFWKERGRAEEEDRQKRRQEEEVEERQQGEGESASETSENVGSVGRQDYLLRPHCFNMKEGEGEESVEDEKDEEGAPEKLTSSFRPAVLRRSLSEGSLLQEPRSPRFLSDSTIHRLTRPVTFDLDPELEQDLRPPSPHTLRKQLTREGGSLYHMLLLLNGNKEPESKNFELRKKTKSLAADVRSRLLFLRRRRNSSWFSSNSLEKALRNNRPSAGEVLSWAEGLETLLTNQSFLLSFYWSDGLAVFRHFLRSEFSEENLDFWLAVERFKKTRPLSKMATRAEKIYAEFISTSAVRQVNVDSSVRESTSRALRLGIHPASFQLAQNQIFGLMESDSYPRFLRSHLYAQLANQRTAMVLASQDAARSVTQS
ncbi:regulator of G-protein signaling 3-like isoform X3 [Channa argus]|uniref:regulator of G-protein signaling 3-like isoform X3 n=1 Tax=Channa argus TaxID=215402 RepID=UPI0035222943